MLDLRPSSTVPSLLLLRPGEPPVKLARLDPLIVRCFGVGSILTRRLFMALAGRACRRAIGLSSAVVISSSVSEINACRTDDGVPVESCGVEVGVLCKVLFPFAGVEGD
jgi:hypothetical protein